MAESDVLLVPVTVEAMVVSRQAEAHAFRRWRPGFSALRTFDSPEPAAFEPGIGVDFTQDARNVGVHLMWTLPRALRTAQGEPPVFPLVPNRWLVVRRHGGGEREVVAWVVESDRAVPGDWFLNDGDEPAWTGIGQALPIQSWRETATAPAFLRAFNPGNPLLAAFQPHQDNVFSFRDTIVSPGLEKDLLSYTVIGWYAQAGDDPLARFLADIPGADLDAFLAAQGWSVADAAGAPMPGRCLFHGAVHMVEWLQHGPTPSSRPDPAGITVAIGDTADEALAPLTLAAINGHLTAAGHPPLAAADGEALLAAVTHGLLYREDDAAFATCTTTRTSSARQAASGRRSGSGRAVRDGANGRRKPQCGVQGLQHTSIRRTVGGNRDIVDNHMWLLALQPAQTAEELFVGQAQLGPDPHPIVRDAIVHRLNGLHASPFRADECHQPLLEHFRGEGWRRRRQREGLGAGGLGGGLGAQHRGRRHQPLPARQLVQQVPAVFMTAKGADHHRIDQHGPDQRQCADQHRQGNKAALPSAQRPHGSSPFSRSAVMSNGLPRAGLSTRAGGDGWALANNGSASIKASGSAPSRLQPTMCSRAPSHSSR